MNTASRESTTEPRSQRTEEEIYETLGLDWIPPELREKGGEIEAAAEHRLPELVEQSQIRGDLHMHTRETDGRATLEEMAEAAHERWATNTSRSRIIPRRSRWPMVSTKRGPSRSRIRSATWISETSGCACFRDRMRHSARWQNGS